MVDEMMKWWKSLFRNHKGFTIVELICSIAIFSVIMTSVGSALVISARSYRNGNVEVGLQQQAQIASNLLTNLIIDSDKVVQASEGKLIVEKVESGGTVTYTIFLSDNELKYYTSTDSTERTLAENITGFVINRAEGENVDFSLKVETGGRSYESDYHVTPRNGVSSGGTALSGTISLFVENKLILEPNQTYDLNVRISGTTNTGFTVDSTDGGINSLDTQITTVGSTIQIKVGSTEMDSFHFRVVSDADPTVSQNVDVLIRRVNTISANGRKTGGTVNKAGAEYKVSASLAGTNLEKEPGAWYDVDYVDPYTAQWTYEFTKEDEDGNILTYPASNYIEITGQGMEGNIPYITFKLKQNMTQGCKLRVTSTALHPEGTDPANATIETNKSGLKYATVSVSDSWELEYQAWRRNGRLDIGLGLDDSYYYADWATGIRSPANGFAGNAQVNFWGYSASGSPTPVDETTGFNYYTTTDTDAAITVDVGDESPADPNSWELVLNTNKTHTTSALMAYSSPYYTFMGWGGYWSDVSYYKVKIWYEINEGPHAGETVETEEIYSVEDVSIKYKNSVNAGWNRTNQIYVTTSDSIDNYKVYYMFDKGWEEGTALYFSDLSRFVGVVHDDGNDYNDVRCDITVSEQGNDGLADYIMFSLPADKKQECLNKSAGDSGIIREIYEYNPLFEVDKNEAGGGEIRYNYISKEDQDRIKGCAGTVEFHFVEPNISGAALKTMYCPRPDEFTALGNVYYVSGTDSSGTNVQIKIVCSGNNATYQEVSGGAVTSTVSLTWNGSGWSAN